MLDCDAFVGDAVAGQDIAKYVVMRHRAGRPDVLAGQPVLHLPPRLSDREAGLDHEGFDARRTKAVTLSHEMPT